MLNARCLLGNKQIAWQGRRRKGRCLRALRKGRTTSTDEEASLTPASWCSSDLLRNHARLLYWWSMGLLLVLVSMLEMSAICWFLFLCRGSKIFPSFVAFLKSDKPTDGTEDALLAELGALDKALGDGEVSGPT
jgi:hypothetical protein